jgi:hypothetical protein
MIPVWFEHQRRKQSISFSFRNNLPSLVFFFSSKVQMHAFSLGKEDPGLRVYLLINDYVCTLDDSESGMPFQILWGGTYIFSSDRKNWSELPDYTPKGHQEFKSMLDEALLKNEWIHAEVRIVNKYVDWDNEYVVESGIHVLKHLTSMDDFQFNDSSLCRKRKLDEYLSSLPCHTGENSCPQCFFYFL